MPKKQSKSQNIGEQGEDIFRCFASQIGLIPNKIERDYGIDFLCQIPENLSSNYPKIVKFSVIGAIVRTSNAKKPHRSLKKDDIDSMLRADFPIVVILIGLKKKEVYYRFLDAELLKELHETLRCGKRQFILRPRSMNKDNNEFKKSLYVITRNENQQKLRLLFTQLRLHEIIGKAKLTFIYQENGNVVLVEVDDLTQIFDKSKREYLSIRQTYLTGSYTSGIVIPEKAIKENFIRALDDFSRVTIISSHKTYKQMPLILKQASNVVSECAFKHEYFGDEHSLHHKGGLTLVFSDVRFNKFGDHYHRLETIIDPTQNEPLRTYSDLLDFIKNCTANTKMYFGDEAKKGINVNEWPNLIQISHAVKTIGIIYKKLQLSNPKFSLSDILKKKFSRCYGFLDIILNNENKIFGGIMLVPENTDTTSSKGIITVPFLVEIPDGKLLIDVEYEANILFNRKNINNPPIGFVVNKKIGVNSWIFKKISKRIKYPILIVTQNIAYEIHAKCYENIDLKIDTGIRFSIA